MKTAISLRDDLYREVERYAKEHHYKRSEVFAEALRVFFEHMETERMLEALNEVYADADSPEDRGRLKSAGARHVKRLATERF